MPSSPRTYLPGEVFHLTARTQGHQHWFTPEIRGRIVTFIAESAAKWDGRLLAYIVMPNHLHLVVQQGVQELGDLMKPILHRTALLVHWRHGTEGHVFERRYRDRVCGDPEYVRNGILYTNLNAFRANLVGKPSQYVHSSQRHYAEGTPASAEIGAVTDLSTAMRLFAPFVRDQPDACRANYCRYLEWRMARDRWLAAHAEGEAVGPAPAPPIQATNGVPWCELYAPLFPDRRDTTSPEPGSRDRETRAGLHEIALEVVSECGPGDRISLDRIRSRYRAPDAVRLRHEMVRRMRAAGYKGTEVAQYIRISTQAVSKAMNGR